MRISKIHDVKFALCNFSIDCKERNATLYVIYKVIQNNLISGIVRDGAIHHEMNVTLDSFIMCFCLSVVFMRVVNYFQL